MNKLLYVNIGGLVFQIDETAYNKLDTYLNGIRRKYARTEGGDEIIHDIEVRIAELFTEKVGERGAITNDYVDEVITIMGRPDDYEDAAGAEKNSDYTIREDRRGRSRFYRDGDNRILGGVCSGFAQYFDIDPLWLRLGFAFSVLIFGSGFLLYLILWIILPEARTTAEKIEMRGDRVNIDNIERTIKDEAKHFKKKVNEFGDDVKKTFSPENMERTKTSLGEFVERAVHEIKPVFQVIGKVFAAIIIMICLSILIAIGIEVIGDHTENATEIHFLGVHVFGNTDYSSLIIICGLALLIIPLIGLIFSTTKYLMGIKKKIKFVGRTLTFLWLLCLVVVIVIAVKTAGQFRDEATISENYPITQPATGVLYLQLNSLDEENTMWHRRFHEDWDEIVLHDDSVFFRNFDIHIERSVDTNYAVIISQYAKGASRDDAKLNAAQLELTLQQNDSLLMIPSSIHMENGDLWRANEIDITVRIPQDKSIMLDGKLEKYIDDNENTNFLKKDQLYGKRLKMTLAGLTPE